MHNNKFGLFCRTNVSSFGCGTGFDESKAIGVTHYIRQLVCQKCLIETSPTLHARTFETIYWGLWGSRSPLSFHQLKRTFQRDRSRLESTAKKEPGFGLQAKNFPSCFHQAICRPRCSGKIWNPRPAVQLFHNPQSHIFPRFSPPQCSLPHIFFFWQIQTK